jgi:hypothetical protein
VFSLSVGFRSDSSAKSSPASVTQTTDSLLNCRAGRAC